MLSRKILQNLRQCTFELTRGARGTAKINSILLRTPILSPFKRHYAQTPFPFDHKKAQEKRELEKLPKYKQWAKYFESMEFKRKMTKYYLATFGVMLVAFYFYMRDRYHEDKQMKHIKQKYAQDPASLSEYEYLKFKAFSTDKLKPREQKKFRLYQMMRKEFRRKNLFDASVMFEPTPQELDEWYSRQAKPTKKVALADDDKDVLFSNQLELEPEEPKVSNETNPNIQPAKDTTEFFDELASAYDDQVKWEERGIMMGSRRRWLMSQAQGDVLEVACGTGRNIPYLKTEQVDSITFMDSSSKMVEETQKKFRSKFPKYKNAAFAVGKAEDLVDLALDSFKYDTVIEAFGLCAHEDPVKALKNMATLLKPGGRIVLLEHGRSTWDFVNNHLDFRAEKRMHTWACRWNLDIGEMIDDAGLDITYEKRVHLGSTWLLVCKRPEDPFHIEEKPFINKLFGTEFTPVEKK
ncbi:S-adenosyl-L-methionine-dependent methyltransferase [Metschnikowia bicuspidata var. bicuspidata NRRL YB-4993]|uniref:S-adenosyl-L-methionine-dependent methyltransferase n=1 Tax=Metschnikowia bicuspidata var. bicuspidata NRRL YB-4993 TaxID=869754 RepID=A0A1A0HHN2_9ASCO|nr:S-adenosyl-L-methionine-dependent methyltransferase [Metschnikowia bicuspidata var. bicuspidata NRRL YB-4993]OBA23353.1 S-adenosyl-L-methionine-dependent methyltransferase [Metschnikowia bicuspidata var. bicuspidata NRRL YB-4993]